MEILSILMVAVTVEALTEWVKSLKKDGNVDTAMIVSLFIAELDHHRRVLTCSPRWGWSSLCRISVQS